MQRVVFDITSLTRMNTNIPHGLVRVEAAFAEILLKDWRTTEVIYVHKTLLGYLAQLPHVQVVRLLDNWLLPKGVKNRILERFSRALNRCGGMLKPYFPEKTDLYINIGGVDQLPRNRILAFLLRSQHTPFVAFCHDLIPVKYPYLIKRQSFRTHYQSGLDIAATARVILCNSESTRLDLNEYFSSNNLLPLPEITVIPLTSVRLNAAPQWQQNFSALRAGEFILSVGTITERKNQDLLLNIWSRLAANDALKHVKLVLVGKVGVCAEIEIRKLQLDPSILSSVIHFESITDAGLAWLYENCLFTAYPSHYEGWGLPVGESLAYGKACIASSTSSLTEVGQGLCLHINPLDFKSWYEMIIRMITDTRFRTALEVKIRSNFNVRSWNQVGNEFKASLSRQLTPHGPQHH